MNDQEVIQGNYWKEIQNEMPAILEDLRGIVLLTHNSLEFTNIIDFLNKVKPGHFSNVLYISLIRSYNYMQLALERKPLEQKKIFFIDCVSGYAFPPDDGVDDCFYHKPPQNLNELKNIVKFGVEKCNPDVIVIDSLTQFINFSRPTEDEISSLYEFLHSMRGNVLNIVQDTFILLYDTKMSIMQGLPRAHTDLILKIEMSKESGLSPNNLQTLSEYGHESE
jgi:hypothetical protein